MFESNNIDIFLKREELLTVFHELITQIEKKKSLKNITFKIISRFSKDQLSPIIILDQFSLKEIIDHGFSIKYFREHSDLCLAGEDKSFIKKFMTKSGQTIFKPALAKDIFSKEDFV